jgi:thiamine biosynthesis lipoprotein
MFDPTVGPLVRAWGFLPSCPSGLACRHQTREQTVAQARRKVGWQKVSLDEHRKEVQFAIPGMEVDLGGIAKGYAVERATEVLKEHGVRSALVNLGSSSLKALGEPGADPDAQKRSEGAHRCRGWPIFIADPRDRSRAAAEICLHDGEALATSGTYEHTIGIGNNQKSHLINPHTGEALGGTISATVISLDAEVADALTKPFILEHDLATDYASRILALYPYSGVVLLVAKNGELLQRMAGQQLESHRPEREGAAIYSLVHSLE